MNRPTMRRPSAAMLVALFALVLSMGGGSALAAKHYLISSTRQISPKVLTKLKGKTGPQGKTGLQGPQGSQGSQGPQGFQGLQGPKGDAGTNGTNGTNGVAVIQRTTGSATPGDNAGDTASTILSNAGFSNPAANTDNLFFARATFTPPAVCTLAPGDEATIGSGGEIDSDTQVFGGGGPFTPGGPAESMQLGVASATALGAGPHTLTLTFNTNCTGSGQHGSITNIELDTAAIG